MDRRTFLRRAGLASLSGLLGPAVLSGESSSSATTHGRRASNTTDHLVTAGWVEEENARSDRTRAWIIPRRIAGDPNGAVAPIEGYVNQTSYAPGDELVLRVNTHASSYRAFVYRMGFYGGYGARQVAASPVLIGHVQSPATLTPATNMVECHWATSWTTPVTKEWPTGQYLIRLVGSDDEQQYVPFTVRDDTSNAAYLVQSSVTTWQAYNPYGGYSLYGGPVVGKETSLDNRSRVVSFDRPYSHDATALDARGSGDFLGNEFPFVYFAERHGLDVSYVTDVDLHKDSASLLGHKALISLGHDEYWSGQMRDGAERALEHGVNLAFLGANACYRQIRFERSATGEYRRVICYKDAQADPEFKVNPALATGGSWATDPVPRPESSLIGVMYQSYGGKGPLVVADAASWVFKGTGLKNRGTIPDVIGSEFDGFEPGYTHPANVQILAHSPTGSVSGNLHSDAAYYSAGKGKGAVFATGTASWVNRMWISTSRTMRLLGFGPAAGKPYEPLGKITLNVLAAFGPGPASDRHPSVTNWHNFYGTNAPKIAPKDVP